MSQAVIDAIRLRESPPKPPDDPKKEKSRGRKAQQGDAGRPAPQGEPAAAPEAAAEAGPEAAEVG